MYNSKAYVVSTLVGKIPVCSWSLFFDSSVFDGETSVFDWYVVVTAWLVVFGTGSDAATSFFDPADVDVVFLVF